MGLLSRIKTWVADETLTAATLNTEFNNIINNLDPDSIEDASSNAAAMNATKDPYPGTVADAPASLREEIQELRHVIKQITGEAQWYIDPDEDLAEINTKTTVVDLLETGFFQRCKFEYQNTSELTINPGAYHVGTTGKIVRITSATTLAFDTEVAAGKANHYIYLDESNLSALTSNSIDSSSIYTSTTAPTWSDTLMGYYNGSDRCIGHILGDTSLGQLLGFTHDGNGYMQYDTGVTDLTATNIDADWIDVTLTIPAFCQHANVRFAYNYSSTANNLVARTKGTTANGVNVGAVNTEAALSVVFTEMMTDSAQKIQLVSDTSGGETALVDTQGWYFPRGM